MATTLKEGVDIINESLKAIGYTDFEIDTTDDTTMTEGLEKLGTLPAEQVNPILNQMNLVLQTRNYAAMFSAEDNPFRAFVIDLIESGFGIEDIFHELIEGTSPQWDKSATGEEKADKLFSYDNNKIHKTFHIVNDANQVKTTIDMRNYKKLFTPFGVTHFMDTKIANLSYSMEVWLLDKIIEVAKLMIDNQRCIFKEGMDLNTIQGVANACELIRATTSGFTTINSLYNYGVYDTSTQSFRSVRTITKRAEDIYIITTPENFERLKVQGYSNAFNLSEFELKNRVIYAPAGTDLGESPTGEEVLFLALDRRTLVIGINFWKGSSQYIATSFETNNFLTAEILKGYNTFFNCVAFCGDSVVPIKKKGNITTLAITMTNSYYSNYFSDAVIKYNGVTLDNSDFNLIITDDTYENKTYQYSKPLYGGTFEFNWNTHIDSATMYFDGSPMIMTRALQEFSVLVPSGTSITTSPIDIY